MFLKSQFTFLSKTFLVKSLNWLQRIVVLTHGHSEILDICVCLYIYIYIQSSCLPIGSPLLDAKPKKLSGYIIHLGTSQFYPMISNSITSYPQYFSHKRYKYHPNSSDIDKPPIHLFFGNKPSFKSGKSPVRKKNPHFDFNHGPMAKSVLHGSS